MSTNFASLAGLLALARQGRKNAAKSEWQLLPKEFRALAMRYAISVATIQATPNIEFTLDTQWGRVTFSSRSDCPPDIIRLEDYFDLVTEVSSANPA